MNRILPPVIRVFLSSTFSDMENERNYFNTVIAPQLTKICADRGVSFFSVDLRWGITAEDQIDGKVLPICLREIDNCRPYFIGIVGNRYGSVVEYIDSSSEDSFPWLRGKSGRSITELEMLYGVLDTEMNKEHTNCVFFFRSDSLTKHFLSESVSPSEEIDKKVKLSELKTKIRSTPDIPSFEYGSLEEFQKNVLEIFNVWLERDFPTAESIQVARRKWYNSELLRDYIDLEQIRIFLDRYCRHSDRSLLIKGKGLRGKTTALTYWKPDDGYKILINCASDDHYLYWPQIAHEIINKINEIDEDAGLPEFQAYATFFFRLFRSHTEKEKDSLIYYVTDGELESFRYGFKKWLREVHVNRHIYIVINDVNLLPDQGSRYLNWLPAENSKDVDIICSANTDEVAENAELLGWNIKEMPLFTECESRLFLDNHLEIYGKKLSSLQKQNLLSSLLMSYPGYLKFAVKYLNNYGRFENLDHLTQRIGEIQSASEMYSKVWEAVSEHLDDRRKKAVQLAFYILAVTTIGLKEDDLYGLVSRFTEITALIWSDVRTVLSLFGQTEKEPWKGEDPDFCHLARSFSVEENKVNSLLSEFFFSHIDEKIASTLEGIRNNTELAKAAVIHCVAAKEWEALCELLEDRKILYYLSKLEWSTVRSAWMSIFLNSEIRIAERLLALLQTLVKEKSRIEGIQYRIIALLVDLEQWDAAEEASKQYGIPHYSDLRRLDGEQISPVVAEKYKELSRLKEQHQFRSLYKEIRPFLADCWEEMNPYDRCCMLFLQFDCEHNQGLFRECTDTSYRYYKEAVSSMGSYEILRAVIARGTARYFSKDFEEADRLFRYAINLAAGEGALREYLGVNNLLGMCCYRMQRIDQALELFDLCYKSWSRLGNMRECTAVLLNRCNALDLKGDTASAYKEAAELVGKIEESAEPRLQPLKSSLLGNMGLWAERLDWDDVAEQSYQKAMEVGKQFPEEVTLFNEYNNLFQFYKKHNLFFKAISTGKEFLNYLEQHHRLREHEEILQEVMDLMKIAKYEGDAADLLDQRKTDRGGSPDEEESHPQCHRGDTDPSDLDVLTEMLAVARSENNPAKCAEILEKTAFLQEQSVKELAIDSYIEAIQNYALSDSQGKSTHCVCRAVCLLIDQWETDSRIPVLLEAMDETERKIVNCWRKMRNSELLARQYEELVDFILETGEEKQELAVCCLTSETEKTVKLCGSQAVYLSLDFIRKYSGEAVSSQLIQDVMLKDFYEDLTLLRLNYVGKNAEEKLRYYEKCVDILVKLDSQDAAAVAGNIALIFRRRREKEKTYHYHRISMDQYRKKHCDRDAYIEALNLSTAYKDFGESDKAMGLLRQSLSELQDGEKGRIDDLRAAIAGNLAQMLMNNESADEDEIRRYFRIEEEYFEDSGEERELAISLLNQVRFLIRDTQKNEEALQSKYKRAADIVYRHQFREFYSMVKELGEMIPAKTGGTEHTFEEEQGPNPLRRMLKILLPRKIGSQRRRATAEEYVKKLLSLQKTYEIAETVEKQGEGYIHVLCKPFENVPGLILNLHLIIDLPGTNTLNMIFALQPVITPPHILMVFRQYADWWNRQNDYKLNVQEEGNVLIAAEKCSLADFTQAAERFKHIEKLWMADALNMSLASIGIEETDLFQEMKLKVIGK
ncbi:MAG: DUF4062 domain-containing protein [Eubacteriales bacterium]|nr:DUF4062 domain-containing protein [Eubacteriales bacterium]